MGLQGKAARPRAFFSYSRADWNKVEQLVGALRLIGVDVWVDFQNIIPGDKWQSVITNALNGADAFVLCLSPLLLESARVHDELAAARDRGLKIIPVMVENVSFDLLPAEVVETQMLRFADYPRRRAARTLAEHIAEAMGVAVEPMEEEGSLRRGLVVYLGTSAGPVASMMNVHASFQDGTLLEEIEIQSLDSAALRTLAGVADICTGAVIVTGDDVDASDIGVVTGFMVGSLGLDRVRIFATSEGRNIVQRLIPSTNQSLL
jgi:TIR domain